MRMTTLLLAILVSHALVAGAQGTIAGCISDTSGNALAGAEVVVSDSPVRRSAITDSAGCYRFMGLPDGTYTVTADLAGFVIGRRGGVGLASGRGAQTVDFVLCPRPLEQIDWVLRGGLPEAWVHADVVAHVRIAATRRVRSDCPTRDVRHAADVIELLKGERTAFGGGTLTFRQEQWAGERTPYAVGQQMILFLVKQDVELRRLAGPHYAFLLEEHRITSFRSPVSTDGMTPADLLARLRALARD